MGDEVLTVTDAWVWCAKSLATVRTRTDELRGVYVVVTARDGDLHVTARMYVGVGEDRITYEEALVRAVKAARAAIDTTPPPF